MSHLVSNVQFLRLKHAIFSEIITNINIFNIVIIVIKIIMQTHIKYYSSIIFLSKLFLKKNVENNL